MLNTNWEFGEKCSLKFVSQIISQLRKKDITAIHLLLLKQGDRSLEDYTSDFLDLECLTNYPDELCFFF